MDNYNLQHLVRCPTCFKLGKPRSIDLILKNGKSSFQKTVAMEIGLSDFHARIVNALKGGFIKRGPKIATYRDYSIFSAVGFKDNLVRMVSSELSEIEDYGAFEAGVMRVLNEHAPVKVDNPSKSVIFIKFSFLSNIIQNLSEILKSQCLLVYLHAFTCFLKILMRLWKNFSLATP